MTRVPDTAGARDWKRLDGVDLLRGLAIFFVLMNHVNMQLLMSGLPYTRGLPTQLISSLVWNGQPGVQIFFAISGFLITSTSLRRWGTLGHVSMTGFYKLRFARIAPLMLTLLALLSLLHAAHVRHFVVSPATGGLGRALVAALTFHINLLEATRGYLPGNWDILWSLSVEEMFYLFFPLLCRLLARGKLFIGLLLVFVVLGPFGRTVLAHGNPVWKEYSYLGGMDAIALGCLTALTLARWQLSRRVLWVMGSSGVALLIVTLGFSITCMSWGLERSGLYMTMVAVGTCMLIAVVTQTRWKSPRWLAPLRTLGQRSYEVYLTHMFIVVAMYQLFAVAGKPLRAVPLLFLAVIVVAGLLGAAVARFYSEPMNRWLRQKLNNVPGKLGSVVVEEAAG